MDTKLKSSAIQKLSEVAEAISNPAILDWKKNGGKVMGYFCSSMSAEIIMAAGLLPFRMRATGSESTELSDAYVSRLNCGFMRHCFNAALKGDLDFLDGLIVPNSCDNIRRVYDHFLRLKQTSFIQMISLPRKAEEPQVEWYRDELLNLKENLENHFRVKITNEGLLDAIKLRNETRQLQRKLYDFRKADAPPITGAETLAVTVAATALPADQYNKLLKQLIEDFSASQGNTNHKARLMILGSELDNPGYIKAIEDQGAIVVTDSLCYGSRMFWEDVDEDASDPLTAISRYYISKRPSCPRVYGRYEQRSDFVKQMIHDFKVDGVILERLTFCDLWGFEQFTIKNEFEEWGIPLMMLDRDYTLSGMGQLKTRAQAFIETIGR